MNKYIMVEYQCPVHGVFETLIERVDGETPETAPCPAGECVHTESPRVLSATSGWCQISE